MKHYLAYILIFRFLLGFTSVSYSQNWSYTRVSLPIGNIVSMFNGKAIAYQMYDITDSKQMITGVPDTIFITTDYGVTWSDTISVLGKGNYYFSSERNGYFSKFRTQSGKSMYETSDGGVTWLPTGCDGSVGVGSSGIVKNENYILSYSLGKRFRGQPSIGPYGCESTDGGVSWNSASSIINAESFVAYSPKTRMSCGKGFIQVDQNGNEREYDYSSCTIDGISYTPSWGNEKLFANVLCLHPSAKVFAGTRIATSYNTTLKQYENYSREGMYVSSDSGMSFTRLNSFRAKDISFSPDGKFGVALALAVDSTRRYILRTNDYGNTWGVQYLDDSSPAKFPTKAVVIDSLHVLILCEDGNIIRTANGGGEIRKLSSEVSSVGDDVRSNIEVYPNPTLDVLNIHFQFAKLITLLNSLGQSVYSANANSSTFAVDCSTLTNGVYSLVVQSKAGHTYQTNVVIWR